MSHRREPAISKHTREKILQHAHQYIIFDNNQLCSFTPNISFLQKKQLFKQFDMTIAQEFPITAETTKKKMTARPEAKHGVFGTIYCMGYRNRKMELFPQ